MARLLTIILALMLGLTGAQASESATPQEVIAKVKEAAAYLAENGKSGLETLGSPDSPFVWKDSYVFVYDCEAGLADVAHPVPETKENAIDQDKDASGRVIGPGLCKAAAAPNGGWFEYQWLKPVKAEDGKELTYAKETSRKVSYMLGVEGQPYQVGAGIYNDTLSVDELNAMIEN
ncbi:MAG TPA: cache domain-containing protein [Methyloceanibacter sp.]|nr:cache domain-containing protein [Methyloceanibacter sp.]